MKEKSLAKNAVLNGIRSLMSVIFPLITFPYISKTLSVESLGKYNFANSVNSYFLLLSGLGITTYAIREGARIRDNKKKTSKFISEVFSINIISTLFSYALLIIIIFTVQKFDAYKFLILIFSIEILFKTLGTKYLYSIFEKYKFITIRSICFQLISLVLLLCFVKHENDYYIYAIITVFANAGANIINFIFSKKYCKIRFTKNLDIKKHLKPIMIIFSTSIAVTVYVNSDVLILGLMATDYNVGLYSISVKIYNVIKTVLSAILMVSIPRLSNYIGNHEMNKYQSTLDKIINAMLTLIFPVIFGIVCLSKEVILIISNHGYIESYRSLIILMGALFFSMFGWVYNSCVLIPNKKEKEALIATIVSAVLNVVLNIILIPFFKQEAAAFTTLLAEACAMFICIHYSKGLYKYKINIKAILSILIGGIGIISICFVTNLFDFGIYPNFITSVVLSMIYYFIIMLIFKNEFLFNILVRIRGLLKNKKRRS